MMTKNEMRLEALFDELVPMSGKAESKAGEIVRAISRIGYRNWNDGDHVGVGYGKETCNPAARYLMENTNEEIAALVTGLWGMVNDAAYDAILEVLNGKVADYVEGNPALRNEPTKDMFDYRIASEDVDDSWEDDEDDYWEEEEEEEEDYE